MENNFTFTDFLAMHELILNLRESTVPKNEHVDDVTLDLMWHKLDQSLIAMGNRFKEELIDKDAVEKMMGKKIHSFEKEYDDNGVFKGVRVVPVQSVQFITCQFTVTPTGTEFKD